MADLSFQIKLFRFSFFDPQIKSALFRASPKKNAASCLTLRPKKWILRAVLNELCFTRLLGILTIKKRFALNTHQTRQLKLKPRGVAAAEPSWQSRFSEQVSSLSIDRRESFNLYDKLEQSARKSFYYEI